jgi:hypothetical protein
MLRVSCLLAWLPLVVAPGSVDAQAPRGKGDATSPYWEIQKLISKVFGNTRSLRVLLPPGYRDRENASERYPVLYLNNGIMVAKALDLEAAVHGLVKAGTIRPLLVVVIDDGGTTDKATNPVQDRANEFLPYPDAGFAPGRSVRSTQRRDTNCPRHVGPPRGGPFSLRAEVDENREDRSKLTVLRRDSPAGPSRRAAYQTCRAYASFGRTALRRPDTGRRWRPLFIFDPLRG